MKHSTLLGSALRASCIQHSKRHAQPSAILISRLGELSRRTQLSSARSYSPRPSSTTIATTTIATTAPNHDLAPSAANPPPTTRPPPLNLPARPPAATAFFSQANFSYLLARGMAYLAFYKTGIKHIFTNTRLLYSSSTSDPELRSNRPYPSTRAHLHLRLRWQHDIRRLPLFALILIVCGELTPLAVLALPRAVPLPCRIPGQVDKILRGDEERRREGRSEVSSTKGDQAGTVPVAALAKILGLAPRSWTPRFVLAPRVQGRLKFLAVDDALLIQSGGEKALVLEEARLACVDRGIDVLGRSEEELRAALRTWLRLTDGRRLGEEGREKAVLRLLVTKESEWGA